MNSSLLNLKMLPHTGADYMNTILIGIGMMMIGLFVYEKRMKRK
ncbi:LPXTG cell wall anchor domain-containing protein [Bacillus cereus group sp. BfR-BA-01380]|nr:LPXTG cell wall anchor domain-containing protein [Bacillus cereus group sp. BfR-BA-01380]